jgi:hypothetical protein
MQFAHQGDRRAKAGDSDASTHGKILANTAESHAGEI